MFVVVDLETTGTSPDGDAITEIGAVKVRAGEVLGEFQTLVRPSGAIPPFIQVLTGITDAMVADAPRIEAALPAFLEFARGAVLVAHNAPFDVGFLKAAAARHGIDWPRPGVVDTARLARRVLTRDEAPNCRLATLARLFRSTTQPVHRALADARATVDVLHGLLERVGNEGVHSLDELETYSSRVSPAVRRKRHLAEGLPSAPGVYLFLDADGRVLYIGTSRDLRSRVRSYFTASESRTRMAEMVRLAERVQVVPCATALEAEVRELRLIAEHKPRYNRRSRFPERSVWVALTAEPFPRLSVVREVRDDGGAYLGPFGSRRSALDAVAALHEALPLRQCTPRLPAAPGPRSTRRPAPCTAWAAAGLRARGLRTSRRTRRTSTPPARPSPTTPAASSARWRTGSPGSPPRSGTRRPPSTATGWPPGAGRPPGASGWPRWPASPRSSPPGQTARAGSSRWCATGGWRRPAPRRPARTRAPTSTRCGSPPRSSGRLLPRCRPPSPRRPSACCAGSTPGACASSTSRRATTARTAGASRPSGRAPCGPAWRRRPPARWATSAIGGGCGRPADGPLAARTIVATMVTAIVFVSAEVGRIPEVAEALADLPGVSEVYSVTGDIDLVAMVRVREIDQLASVVTEGIDRVEGVQGTETHIAFRAYSRHDLEAAFALGSA